MLFQIRTNAEILNQIITLLLKVSNCTYINQFILSFSNAGFLFKGKYKVNQWHPNGRYKDLLLPQIEIFLSPPPKNYPN
jgi:hypothetical protein